MDSLLACYGSDDDDEQRDQSPVASKSANAAPDPVAIASNGDGARSGKGMFSFLPAPKKNRGLDYRPPIDVSALDEDEDAADSKKKKPRVDEKEVTVLGGLVLPAPKKSLGFGSALGAGRGQALDFSGHDSSGFPEVVDPEAPVEAAPSSSEALDDPSQQSFAQAGYEDPWQGYQMQGYEENGYPGYGGQDQGYENQEQYQYYDGALGYGDQAQVDAATSAPAPEEDPVAKAMRMENRKGRAEQVKFVKIRQDDLTANRPREDQLRATGIAFGTSFSTVFDKNEEDENKPSKLHKRKHQIGSLYHDMRQKEFELMERRARGQLSKSQTHAKYGW